MSEIIIRSAIESDITKLSEMYRQMYDILFSYGMPYRLNDEIIEDVIKLQLKARAVKFFVAELNNDLVGFVSVDVMKIDRKLNYDENNIMGHVKDIYVSPNIRRTSLASNLLKTAEEWAKENGATIIECNVILNNEPAKNFWNNNQYEVMGYIYSKKI